MNRYESRLYSYNSVLANCFTEPILPPLNFLTKPTYQDQPGALANSPLPNFQQMPPPASRLSTEVLPVRSAPNAVDLNVTPRSVSTTSLKSGSAITGNNEDDYYTADEEDETENPAAEFDRSDEEEPTLATSISQRVGDANGTTVNELTATSARYFVSADTAENKMDLNFDIKRPILDSSLPKYCYLKYLSRAQVKNWNRTYLYPCYEDSTNKNISFAYRKHGINFFNLVSTSYAPKSSMNTDNNFGDAENIEFDMNEKSSSSNDCKCRINLKFSIFECYITPLLLTSLGRFIEALNQYKVSPNSLVTQLQTKAQAHSVANSFKG